MRMKKIVNIINNRENMNMNGAADLGIQKPLIVIQCRLFNHI